MAKTLLQKAAEIKSPPRKQTPSDEEIELALAWANGHIKLSQAQKVLGITGAPIYVRLAFALKEYISREKK